VQGGTPLLVLFGSNLGTCEGIAHQIADDGRTQGFTTTVAPLDDYAEKLPKDGAVVIISSSYNGTPPDDAARFFDWLCNDSLGTDALEGVSYTVFGCGDRDWAATYQRVPKMIDTELEAHGASRVYQRGEGDASDDFDGEFRGWYDHLWNSLAGALGTAVEAPDDIVKGHRYEVELVTEPVQASPLVAEYGARPMEILANRELQNKTGPHPSERSTRHIELAVQEGVAYQPGDHLGILPRNSATLVRRVMERFELPDDALIRIRNNAASKTFLPVDKPVSASSLLSAYVDLQGVARRSEIQVLAEYTECPRKRRSCWPSAATTRTASPTTGDAQDHRRHRADPVSPRRHHLRPPCARACLPGRPGRRSGHSRRHFPQPVKGNIRLRLPHLRSGIRPLLCGHLALGGSA
jgi:cytochrome P450 / NADPH-cytochrome P450 reductase